MNATASMLPLAGLSAAELRAWADLTRRAIEPNPFFHPAFVRPIAERLRARDVSLLVARSGQGAWLACLPVFSLRRWRAVPLPALAAFPSQYCFHSTPLIDPDAGAEDIAVLLRSGQGRPGVAMLAMDLLGAGGPVEALLRSAAEQAGLRVTEYRRFERGALERRADPSGYQPVSAKHRRELRRQAKKLAKHLGTELELVDRTRDEAAVHQFLQLEASGWKGRNGTAFAAIPGHAEMLEEICKGMNEAGILQLLSLQAGGRDIAMGINLTQGGTVFNFKIAFDETLAQYSPGSQFGVLNNEVFHADPTAERMDSCAEPTNTRVNRLWPDRRRLIALGFTGPGPSGAAAARIVRSGGAASAWRRRRLERRVRKPC